MLKDLKPAHYALIIFGVALATIIGAWIFEYAGYAPCPLCLQQRWAYYAAIPLALVVAAVANKNFTFAKYGFILLAMIWVGSAIFGVFHSGVEWGWWQGPTTCAGDLSGSLPDLTSAPVIRCDEASIRILGLSLAGWNAMISAALAALALKAAQGSSSVSQ
jgi:disulfide bond formation protein DsbB